MKISVIVLLAITLKVNALLELENGILKLKPIEISNFKRANDFYENDDNIGYYAYHGKNVKRANDFYEDDDNIGYYAYHGKNVKKRYEDLESQTSFESTDGNRNSRKLKSLLLKRKVQRSTQIPKNSEFVNITSCQFETKTSILSCFNHLIQNSSINCHASLNQSDLTQFNFDKFGIEIPINNLAQKRFNLYPFKLSNETRERVFYNYQIRVNENNIDLGLFHSSTTNNIASGINVEDATCFEKLAHLFTKSAELKTVDFRISSKDASTKIAFIGDIFVDQKPGMTLQSTQRSQ